MALAEVMDSMRESLQRSLDELISPRSSSRSKMKALQSLERDLATACFNTDNDAQVKDAFMALQYTFECNVPAHLISWIMTTTARLETVLNKVSADEGRTSEADDLVAQLALSLSLIQGVTLNHEASKQYLGRRSALEILLDLLLTSRHAGTSQPANSAEGSTAAPHLTSIVLDTLLCILVDSSKALRAFEEASGVHSIVKILKRAGTPREVRMKCLEFLYFYLLDETPDADVLKTSQPTPPPTAPATPVRPQKPYLSATPMRPMSRYGSSTLSFSTSTTAALSTSVSSSSSRSTSGSSNHSFCSTTSNASSSTTASSMPASPVKATTPIRSSPVKTSSATPALPPRMPSRSPAKRMMTPMTKRLPTSPPSSPPALPSAPASAPAFVTGAGTAGRFPQIRSMMMLRKEVDYTPQSPKKAPVPGLAPKPGHRKSLSASASLHLRSRSQATLVGVSAGLGSETRRRSEEDGKSEASMLRSASLYQLSPTRVSSKDRDEERERERERRERDWKTTDEKKELLGTMLGNVDALVEGVRKAGIWGLG